MKRRWGMCVLLLSLPMTAIAGGPSGPGPGSCSSAPARIVLVGTDGTSPDRALGGFEIQVCWFMDPQPGKSVSLTAGSGSGLRLARESEPSLAAPCPAERIWAQTDAEGRCRITLAGSVDLSVQTPGLQPTVSINAGGSFYVEVPVVCHDLDGANGVGANDLGLWLQLFGSGEEWLIADYNADGHLGADDLSLWLDIFGSGAQAVSATPLCP